MHFYHYECLRVYFRKLLCDRHRKIVFAVNLVLIFIRNMRWKWKTAFASQILEVSCFVVLSKTCRKEGIQGAYGAALTFNLH